MVAKTKKKGGLEPGAFYLHSSGSIEKHSLRIQNNNIMIIKAALISCMLPRCPFFPGLGSAELLGNSFQLDLMGLVFALSLLLSSLDHVLRRDNSSMDERTLVTRFEQKSRSDHNVF